MIRGAIFDIDGVLLDSMYIWKELGSRYLEERGIKPRPDLNKKLFSMSMEQGAEYLRNNFMPDIAAEKILEDIKKMLEHFYFSEVNAKTGARETLEFISAHGINAAAATSSPRSHVVRALDRLDMLKYFKGIYTTAEVGESKHSPRIYKAAADFLNSKPHNTLVFEDSLYALKTAEKAGFIAIGVYDEYGEDDIEGMRSHSRVYLKGIADFLSSKIL